VELPKNISRVLVKHRYTGTTDRKKGSGRPLTAMTDENLAEVKQLCTINLQELTTASVKPHVSLACHEIECWSEAIASIRSREWGHQQWMFCDWQSRSTSARFSITVFLEILLQSEYQSIVFRWNTSFAKTIFSLIFKCVICMIRFW